MKELEAVKLENCEFKKKLEAAKARIRNLECDSTLIRQNMQTFVEKSNHDDMLINEQRVSDCLKVCFEFYWFFFNSIITIIYFRTRLNTQSCIIKNY